jgi:plastocyanin
MHRTIRRGATVLALTAALGLAACGDDGGDQAGGAGGAGENEVELVKLEFQPGTLTVDAGTEVTWTWTENLAHNVIAEDGSFASDVQPSGTFSHTFDEPGEYPYDCTLHPGMEGTIIVE